MPKQKRSQKCARKHHISSPSPVLSALVATETNTSTSSSSSSSSSCNENDLSGGPPALPSSSDTMKKHAEHHKGSHASSTTENDLPHTPALPSEHPTRSTSLRPTSSLPLSSSSSSSGVTSSSTLASLQASMVVPSSLYAWKRWRKRARDVAFLYLPQETLVAHAQIAAAVDDENDSEMEEDKSHITEGNVADNENNAPFTHDVPIETLESKKKKRKLHPDEEWYAALLLMRAKRTCDSVDLCAHAPL